MRTFLGTLAAVLVLASLQTAAHAHFIWATVENHQVRFALLENIAEAPSAKFEKYVSSLTPLCSGKKLTLGESKDGARYAPLAAGQKVVVAESVIGAKERNGETYLLVYHAKGAASLAAAGTNAKEPVELQARREGNSLILSVHQNRRPVAESEVWVQWPGEEEPSRVKTDAQGNAKAEWPTAPQSGMVGIRAMTTEATPGESEGKKYTSVHHWATLTFPIEGAKPAQCSP